MTPAVEGTGYRVDRWTSRATSSRALFLIAGPTPVSDEIAAQLMAAATHDSALAGAEQVAIADYLASRPTRRIADRVFPADDSTVAVVRGDRAGRLWTHDSTWLQLIPLEPASRRPLREILLVAEIPLGVSGPLLFTCHLRGDICSDLIVSRLP